MKVICNFIFVKLFLPFFIFIYSVITRLMNFRYVLSLLFFSLLCFNCINANTKSFIVKKENRDNKSFSKTELKEKIGIQIKDILNQCTQLNRHLGEVQIEFSKVQNQLFEKIEELIDNKRPFKKASRHQLDQTLAVVRGVNAKLVAQVEDIKNIITCIDRDVCLKKNG